MFRAQCFAFWAQVVIGLRGLGLGLRVHFAAYPGFGSGAIWDFQSVALRVPNISGCRGDSTITYPEYDHNIP